MKSARLAPMSLKQPWPVKRCGDPGRPLGQGAGRMWFFWVTCQSDGGDSCLEQVELSHPKPRGSSLVPLHMTRLSRFESISSSTLAAWTPAKEAES